jgi:hypothetical protein
MGGYSGGGGALGGLANGILAGIELRQRLRAAADQHQQMLQNQQMQQQQMQQQQHDSVMKNLADRLNLEMQGARPVNNGMVQEMLSTTDAMPSAPQQATQATMGPSDALRAEVSTPAGAQGEPQPPALTPSTAVSQPTAPAIAGGTPVATGGIMRKADRSRTVTIPGLQGEKLDYEIPTPEEQIQRQNTLAENLETRKQIGLQKATAAALHVFGVDTPPEIAAVFPGLGPKVLRSEIPALTEKIAQMRNASFKEVTPGAALVNTGAVPGAPGAPGAPAGGAAAPGGPVVFKNPPLEDAATRSARGFTAETLGKKPEDVTYDELAKGKAAWEYATMNPLDRKIKEGDLARQPLDLLAKKGEVANQALDRSLKQNELDLANDPEMMRMAGEKLLQTGQLGGMGKSKLLMGKAYAAAAELAKERGIDPATIPGIQSGYKALSESLADIQKKQSQIVAFEKGGAANLDNFIQLAQKQIDSGSPLINRTLRGAAKTLTGSTDQAAADTARVAAFNEISKILSGSLGNAGVSDSGRKEAEDLLRGDYTMPQLLKVAKVLRTDMKNRSDAYGQQLNSIRQDMQSLTAPKGGNTVKLQAPDGTVSDVPADQVDHYIQLGAKKVGQ